MWLGDDRPVCKWLKPDDPSLVTDQIVPDYCISSCIIVSFTFSSGLTFYVRTDRKWIDLRALTQETVGQPCKKSIENRILIPKHNHHVVAAGK
jgi:hypothetical protein